MEKIKLNNSQEFELVPMGIDDLSGSRRFKIISTLGHSETLQQFTDEENIETIDYILADGTVCVTYMDCVGFKNITYAPNAIEEDDKVQNIYIVELSVNAVERMLRTMQRKLNVLENENAILKEQNALLTETVDYLVLSKLEKDTELPLTPIETPEEESEVEEDV